MSFFFRAYFFLLPFQFALSPFEGVDLAIIRVISILAGCFWLAWSLLRRKIILPKDASSWCLLAFVFLASLSMVWAEDSAFAFRKVAFLLSFMPLYFILSVWFEEFPTERLLVLRAFVWGATLLGVVALLLFLAQFVLGVDRVFAFLVGNILPFFLGDTFAQAVAAHPSLLVNISGATLLRASGVFPDPHMFAYYVGMAAPLALVLYFREKPRQWQWLFVGSGLLIVDLLSFSRGGLVGLLLTGAVIVFFLRRSVFPNRRRFVTLLSIGGFVLIGMVYSPLGARFTSIFSQEDGSNVERLRLWQEAVVHIGERPLLGVGIGNYPLLVKPGVAYREPIYAHNLYLDLALETGLLGLFLFLGFLGVVVFSLIRSFLLSGTLEPLLVLGSLVVFIGHSFFETPLFSVHVLPALLLILSLGVSYRHHEVRY